jgi:hypothetical protein
MCEPNLNWTTSVLTVGGGFPVSSAGALSRVWKIEAVLDLPTDHRGAA